MQTAIRFDPMRLPPETEKLRQEVRAFIADEIAAGTFDPHAGLRTECFNREFSTRVGAKGWIGMTWPKKYGGHERSYLDRYVVTEEFRAVTAPTWGHFVADRQSGPVILKYGSEKVKEQILPRIVKGEVGFAIGMSEPGSGSDLFAASSKAEKVDGGYKLNGAKIWTSNAHQADYMIGLFRTSPPTKENRRHGLTQFVIAMDWDGISVNPIYQMTGKHDFNEVMFEDVFVPEDYVLGEVDGAWNQATSELAYYVLMALIRAVSEAEENGADVRVSEGIGRLVAQLHTLRRMSVSVAGMLEAGKEPVLESSIVKDSGTVWEQELPSKVRDLAAFVDQDPGNDTDLQEIIDFALLQAPKFTIQGGTTEVLRGIIARGLGLR